MMAGLAIDTPTGKDTPKPGDKGGSGAGPVTVHGCDKDGCFNTQQPPREKTKKCKKNEKGIEVCT